MNVNDEKKISLIKFTEQPISIKEKKYSAKIEEHILIHNLAPDDLPYLFSTYSQLVPVLQEIIFNYAKDNINIIINKPDSTDQQLIDKLLKASDITHENRAKLLIANLSNLTQDNVINYLKIIGKEELCRIFDQNTRTRFENNDLNRELIKGFVNRGWLDDCTEEGDNLKIRRKKL